MSQSLTNKSSVIHIFDLTLQWQWYCSLIMGKKEFLHQGKIGRKLEVKEAVIFLLGHYYTSPDYIHYPQQKTKIGLWKIVFPWKQKCLKKFSLVDSGFVGVGSIFEYVKLHLNPSCAHNTFPFWNFQEGRGDRNQIPEEGWDRSLFTKKIAQARKVVNTKSNSKKGG